MTLSNVIILHLICLMYIIASQKTFSKKDFENIVSLIVNYSTNTFNIIIIHEMMNSELDDVYDIVSKNFTVMLSIIFNNIYNIVLKILQ